MRLSLQDDLYRFALTTSWPRFIGAAAAAFAILNTIFAGLYTMAGGVTGAHTFGDLFFFSVETFATVGFGDMIPRTALARIIATTEAFASIAMLALATGLIFARFARPAASILFAPHLALGDADGSFSLMARLANGRRDAIIESTARVWLVWLERYEDAETRRYRELVLVKPDHPVFLQTWTLFHVVDASSPLHGKSEAELRLAGATFLVTFRGIDQRTSQQVAALKDYAMDDTHWNGRFRTVPYLSGRRMRTGHLDFETVGVDTTWPGAS